MPNFLARFRFAAVAPFLGLLVPLGGMFGPGLFGGQGLVFRDAAHFYYPLFHEVRRQWSLGEIPLWNPFDGIGMPLAADATAGVFYPGKLLFCLPLEFGWLFHLYAVLHVALAYGATYWVARAWGLSRVAGVLAAVSYGFGGAVVGYHSNVVFLVGAAWLPLGIWAGERVIAGPNRTNVCGLAVCLAMMVLGGDPQLAYHLPLVCLPLLFFRRPSTELSPAPHRRYWPALGLGLALLLALGLAAVQVLPTAQWSQRSVRHVREAPRNLYEAAYDLATRQEGVSWEVLAGNPDPNTHERQAYDFSIGIWRWPELWWPNFGGSMYPENHRWARAIPAEGRVWLASLYLGSLPFMLACLAWNLRSPKVRIRWLSWLVLAAGLAALGWYGLGWVIHEVGYASGWFDADRLGVGQPLGGLYWLLNVAVPGYVSFRYPGKWWIVVSLAASLLAAYGWDRQAADGFRLVKRAALALLAVSGVLGVGVLLGSGALAERLPAVPPDGLFGPLDAEAGLKIAAWGMLQTTVTLALIGGGLLAWRRYPTAAAWGVAAVVMIDLLIANRQLVQYAPLATWQQRSIADELPEGPSTEAPGLYRRRYETYYPREFAQATSPDRQREALALDRWGMFPRYHLLDQVRVIHPVSGIAPADYEALLRTASTAGQLPSLLELLGTEYVVQPADRPVPADFQRVAQWEKGDRQVALWETPRRQPVAWMVALSLELDLPADSRRSTLQARTQEVWLDQQERPRDWREVVVLEESPFKRLKVPPALELTAQVSTRRLGPGRLEISVETDRPGYLVVREYYDPGWRAAIRTADSGKVRQARPIRANRVMQAIWLPAGRHEVSLSYRPWPVIWGGVISGLSWLALAVVCGVGLWRQLRSGSSGPR